MSRAKDSTWPSDLAKCILLCRGKHADAAQLLLRICHWHKYAKISLSGSSGRWIANDREFWQREVRLSKDQCDRCLSRLEDWRCSIRRQSSRRDKTPVTLVLDSGDLNSRSSAIHRPEEPRAKFFAIYASDRYAAAWHRHVFLDIARCIWRGKHADAALLLRICHWHKYAKISLSGSSGRWIANDREFWQREVRLSKDQCDRCLSRLEDWRRSI